MEDVSERHPILIKTMVRNVDNKSLDTLKTVSRELSGFLEEERFYWLRVIQSYDENDIKQEIGRQNSIRSNQEVGIGPL